MFFSLLLSACCHLPSHKKHYITANKVRETGSRRLKLRACDSRRKQGPEAELNGRWYKSRLLQLPRVLMEGTWLMMALLRVDLSLPPALRRELSPVGV